jgi:hypothetical protein
MAPWHAQWTADHRGRATTAARNRASVASPRTHLSRPPSPDAGAGQRTHVARGVPRAEPSVRSLSARMPLPVRAVSRAVAARFADGATATPMPAGARVRHVERPWGTRRGGLSRATRAARRRRSQRVERAGVLGPEGVLERRQRRQGGRAHAGRGHDEREPARAVRDVRHVRLVGGERATHVGGGGDRGEREARARLRVRREPRQHVEVAGARRLEVEPPRADHGAVAVGDRFRERRGGEGLRGARGLLLRDGRGRRVCARERVAEAEALRERDRAPALRERERPREVGAREAGLDAVERRRGHARAGRRALGVGEEPAEAPRPLERAVRRGAARVGVAREKVGAGGRERRVGLEVGRADVCRRRDGLGRGGRGLRAAPEGRERPDDAHAVPWPRAPSGLPATHCGLSSACRVAGREPSRANRSTTACRGRWVTSAAAVAAAIWVAVGALD